MKAFATTGMNEYCTNALSQFQNSHSQLGTMKNGIKSGPRSAQTALAIMPNETTKSSANCARAIRRSISQYRRFARIDQGSGCSSAFQSVVRLSCAFCTDRALRMDARKAGWSVIRLENEIPSPGSGDS